MQGCGHPTAKTKISPHGPSALRPTSNRPSCTRCLTSSFSEEQRFPHKGCRKLLGVSRVHLGAPCSSRLTRSPRSPISPGPVCPRLGKGPEPQRGSRKSKTISVIMDEGRQIAGPARAYSVPGMSQILQRPGRRHKTYFVCSARARGEASKRHLGSFRKPRGLLGTPHLPQHRPNAVGTHRGFLRPISGGSGGNRPE